MWLYRMINQLRPVFGRYWDFSIQGHLDRVPERGPLLLAANHVSFLDPWYLCVLFPREVSFLMTDKWYYKSAVWEWFFASQGTLPVTADDPEATIADMCRWLGMGRTIGVFPEGAISPEARLRRFRPGLARAAALSGAPVMPIGLRGTHESLPLTGRWPRRGRIEVHVGRPMLFPGAPHDRLPSRRAVQAFTEEVFAEVHALCGQEVADDVVRARSRRRERAAASIAAVERG